MTLTSCEAMELLRIYLLLGYLALSGTIFVFSNISLRDYTLIPLLQDENIKRTFQTDP